MRPLEAEGPTLQRAVARRSSRIHDALESLSLEELEAPSLLPGWSRLTLACHLRYGSRALISMTRSARAGRPAAYYPFGREVQRAATLVPDPGEAPADVVQALRAADQALASEWASLPADAWGLEVHEPAGGGPDLGSQSLARLGLLRLSEVEVHGSDLGISGALVGWSEDFVRLALPFRLDWLNTRRSNHRAVDDALEGTWLLVPAAGPAYLVSLSAGVVTSHPAPPDAAADAVVSGSGRDLLAFLLGRPTHQPLRITGDQAFGRAFQRAFPGP